MTNDPIFGPQLPPTVLREAEQTSSPTTDELLLLTFGLITSLVLTLSPSPGRTDKARKPGFSWCFAIVPVVFVQLGFVLVLASLVLVWLKKISLDAFTAVAFALSPGLLSAPYDAFSYLKQTKSSRLLFGDPSFKCLKDRSKPSEKKLFHYIRYGKACGEDPNCEKLKSDADPCLGKACKIDMFIRRLPDKKQDQYSLGAVSRCLRSLFHTTVSSGRPSKYNDPEAGSTQEEDPILQFHGKRIEHTTHFVLLQDVHYGVTNSWWEQVSSSIYLVDQPSRLLLNDKKRVVVALSLISDIIIIGDLVLKYRVNFLTDQLKHDMELRAALPAIPGVVSKKLIEQLDLIGWGQLGPEILSDDYKYTINSEERYSVLFFILAHRSQVFMKVENNRKTGQEIVEDILKTSKLDDEAFREKCTELVDEWLHAVGCEKPLPISEQEQAIKERLEKEEECRVALIMSKVQAGLKTLSELRGINSAPL